jgi:transglutaminase-like putative cysteine protease
MHEVSMKNLSRASAASERARTSSTSRRSRPGARVSETEQARTLIDSDTRAARTVHELAAALRGEITRCARRAVEQAELLESIGAQSFELVSEINADADTEALTRRSHGIRGLVVHSLVVLAELQRAAGRLDALAALRAAERANLEEI